MKIKCACGQTSVFSAEVSPFTTAFRCKSCNRTLRVSAKHIPAAANPYQENLPGLIPDEILAEPSLPQDDNTHAKLQSSACEPIPATKSRQERYEATKHIRSQSRSVSFSDDTSFFSVDLETAPLWVHLVVAPILGLVFGILLTFFALAPMCWYARKFLIEGYLPACWIWLISGAFFSTFGAFIWSGAFDFAFLDPILDYFPHLNEVFF